MPEQQELNQFSKELIRDVLVRLNDESLVRIGLCLEKLTDDQVWWRPNEESNSIGNLILHLCGNVTQWVIAGMGGHEDNRKRHEEFDTREHINKDILWGKLKKVISEASEIIKEQTPEKLLHKRKVQTFEETGISILVHVTEHFSYHTGQIAWITKMLTDDQLGFYAGITLE